MQSARRICERSSRSLHVHWMIVSRTRAFSIIVILAHSEFNPVGSPLYGVALRRHTVSEP
jgi:hypothetical protein